MLIISNQLRGTFLVAFSGMLYGFLGYLGTQLFREHLSVENMLFWRFLIATLWMFFSVILLKKTNHPSDDSALFPPCITHGTEDLNKPSKPGIGTLINIDSFRMIIFAVISYSGCSIFYFMASRQIGTGVAMVIFFSYPVFVTLFAWILSNWEFNKTALVSLLSVVIGMAFLKGYGENTLNLMGVVFAILAALFYAVYVYGSQHTAKNIDTRTSTLLVCLGNTVIFLIFSYCTHSLYFPKTLTAWFYLGTIGIVATALPIQLLLNGLKYISPIKASILSVLEPVVTVIVGLFFLNETMSSMQSLGVVIVLLGAILIQFEKTSEGMGSNLHSPPVDEKL